MPKFSFESEQKKRRSLTRSGPQPTAPQLSPMMVQRATSDVSSLSPQDVMGLQRSIGNRAVQDLLTSASGSTGSTVDSPVTSPITSHTSAPTIQTKLHVGAVDDPYEREADRVASEVVSHPAVDTPTVQRNVKDGEFISRKPTTDVIQRQDDDEIESDLDEDDEFEDEDSYDADYQPTAKDIRWNMGVKFPMWLMAVHGAKTVDKARSKLSGTRKTGIFDRAARGAGNSAVNARNKALRKHRERGLSWRERRRLAKDRRSMRKRERRAFKRDEGGEIDL